MVETLFAKKDDLDSHTGSGGGAHAAVTTSANGFMIATDKTKLDGIAALAVALPVGDATSIVEDPVDPTKEMRIDVEAVATGTIRVLTMPDQDIDLTPSAGDFEAADAGLLSIAGLTTAADRMIYTTAADVYAVATLTQAGRDLLDDVNAGAQRVTLGLVIGTDVQAEDAGLTSIAALTTLADRMIFTTASDVYAVTTLSAAGRDLIDDANAAAQRTTLGLVIGTDVQADLDVPSQAEAEAGTATTERVWTAQRVGQAVVALSGAPRSYLAGLITSNGTDATNDIDIAVGVARSDANDIGIVVTAAVGKQLDVTWAAGGTPGTPTGGLSSTLTPVVNDTWYHIILGLVSGAYEVGFDTSITGSNLVTDHSFTNTRRIGSVRRATAANVVYTQIGDKFMLDLPPLSVDVANLGDAETLFTLLVPLGVQVEAFFHALSFTVNAEIYIYTPGITSQTPSASAGPLGALIMPGANGSTPVGISRTYTNTSSQIAARADAASRVFRLATLGWYDRRGRDA